MNRILSSLLLTICFYLPFLHAQGGTSAVPFLRIAPSARMSGMGEASVGFSNDDPLAPVFNPAQLGMQDQASFFSYGNNSTLWLPQFHLADLWYETFAFNTGVNLSTLMPALGVPVSIGVGYSRVKFNLGTFTATSEQGPYPASTFDAWEKSEQYSFAVGADYWVRASIGFSSKNVRSHMADFGTALYADGIAHLVDYGFLLEVPVAGIAARFHNEKIEILPGLEPMLDWSLGMSRSNSGQTAISYGDIMQADPLPRTVRVGMSFHAGATYRQSTTEVKVISGLWTIEAEDLLTKQRSSISQPIEYQSGLGDIRFFDEVVLGRTNKNTIKKKGWELGFYEVYYVRGGSFEESPQNGNRHFSTNGWTVSSVGIVKLLHLLAGQIRTATILDVFLDAMEIRYSESSLDGKDLSPLDGTKYRSLTIVVRR